MKNGIFYLFLILSGFNCATETQEDQGTLPDNVVVKKTKQHQRVLGTNLFAIIPDTYKFVKPFRYTKSEKEFIILSKFKIPFDLNARKLALENLGPDTKSLSSKEITFNNYPAFFKETINLKKKEHSYILNYGNDKHTIIILAQSLPESTATRKELLQILKSVCEDTAVSFDALETSFFTFDKSITGFKLAKALANDFRYTRTGSYENNNKIVNSIFVNEIGLTTKENRIKLMEDWSETYHSTNTKSQRPNFTETKIGPYDAIEFESTISFNGVNGKVYFVVLSDNQNRTMKFTGIAFEEIEHHMKQYKATIQSIKFK